MPRSQKKFIKTDSTLCALSPLPPKKEKQKTYLQGRHFQHRTTHGKYFCFSCKSWYARRFVSRIVCRFGPTSCVTSRIRHAFPMKFDQRGKLVQRSRSRSASLCFSLASRSYCMAPPRSEPPDLKHMFKLFQHRPTLPTTLSIATSNNIQCGHH